MCKLHILHNGLECGSLHQNQHDDGQSQRPTPRSTTDRSPQAATTAQQIRHGQQTERNDGQRWEVLPEVERIEKGEEKRERRGSERKRTVKESFSSRRPRRRRPERKQPGGMTASTQKGQFAAVFNSAFVEYAEPIDQRPFCPPADRGILYIFGTSQSQKSWLSTLFSTPHFFTKFLDNPLRTHPLNQGLLSQIGIPIKILTLIIFGKEIPVDHRLFIEQSYYRNK